MIFDCSQSILTVLYMHNIGNCFPRSALALPLIGQVNHFMLG